MTSNIELNLSRFDNFGCIPTDKHAMINHNAPSALVR